MSQVGTPLGGRQPRDKGVRKAARDFGPSRQQLSCDIGETERAELLALWVDIVEAKESHKPRQVGAVSKRGIPEGRGNKGGLKKASRDLGLSEGKLRRATKIASLSPEAKEAARAKGVNPLDFLPRNRHKML